MLYVGFKKFTKCRHVDPIKFGLIRIIPVLIIKKNLYLYKQIKKFIQEEYSEYLMVLDESYLNFELDEENIVNYNICTIVPEDTKIRLFYYYEIGQKDFLIINTNEIESTLTQICNLIIQAYRTKMIKETYL